MPGCPHWLAAVTLPSCVDMPMLQARRPIQPSAAQSTAVVVVAIRGDNQQSQWRAVATIGGRRSAGQCGRGQHAPIHGGAPKGFSHEVAERPLSAEEALGARVLEGRAHVAYLEHTQGGC